MNFGETTEACAPYNPNLPTNQPGPHRPCCPPQRQQWRLQSRQQLNENSVADIKAALADGKTVAFSIPVYHSWFDSAAVRQSGNVTMPLPGEAHFAGHAMLFVGYQDDTSTPGGGYFILRNSWGTAWGYQSTYGAGYGTLPYQYMTSHGWEAFTYARVQTICPPAPRVEPICPPRPYYEPICPPRPYYERICPPRPYFEPLCPPRPYYERICPPRPYYEPICPPGPRGMCPPGPRLTCPPGPQEPWFHDPYGFAHHPEAHYYRPAYRSGYGYGPDAGGHAVPYDHATFYADGGYPPGGCHEADYGLNPHLDHGAGQAGSFDPSVRETPQQ